MKRMRFKAVAKIVFPKKYRPEFEGQKVKKIIYYGPNDWELIGLNGYVILRREGKEINAV